MKIGIGNRNPRKGLVRVPQLGLRRPHELAADRRVEEQISDLDDRPDRASAGSRRNKRATLYAQFGTRLRFASPTTDHQMTYFRNRSQRLAAKT